MASGPIGKKVRVTGIVQGVGFRPFVHGLAARHGLTGDVANTSRGVIIHAFGAHDAVHAFLDDLSTDAPPLADVHEVLSEPIPHEEREAFEIITSIDEPGRTVAVTPDACICADCRRELLDRDDRRYRYPFINCVNCGPRFSIITDVPYDRPNTTMVDFTMCDDCRREYDDPTNRRHHAQPNACPACGPHCALLNERGEPMDGDPIAGAARELTSGRIVAIKGLGGFHLACDATNATAVARLRKRKEREQKPFAVMVRDMAAAAELAELPEYAERLLTSPVAPILLAPKRRPEKLAKTVAPVNDRYGVMLPYTPLHVLLFEELGGNVPALVMTSANRTDEPICIDNDEALDRLKGIADAFLMHNRRINLREDDSVLLATRGRPTLVRRSRGYVPRGIETERYVDGWAAFGPMLKNTLAVGRGSEVFPGQHVGDLNNTMAMDMFDEVLKHLTDILGVELTNIACDLHPDYPSTHLAEQTGLPVTPVQHHFAHLVGLMAEKRQYKRAIGFSFDGTGYGDDGAIWGGEVFSFDPTGYRRAYHLEYAAQPGGDRAAREPWRMALSYLHRTGLDYTDFFRGDTPAQVDALLKSDVPQPKTSSLGRLFDAVSSLCKICQRSSYEGQAAMALEGARAEVDGHYGFILREDEVLTDGIIRGAAEDLKSGLPVGTISGRFHNTIIEIMRDCAMALRDAEGLEDVFLTGGCFQNVFLLERGRRRLEEHGYRVFTHTLLPPNDGGVAVGQLLAAASIS